MGAGRPARSTGNKAAARSGLGPEQASCVGNQTGDRVFLFLHTDDFWRDFEAFQARGVKFVRQPRVESYGTVAVFEDLYGNLWDLIQLGAGTLFTAPSLSAGAVRGRRG